MSLPDNITEEQIVNALAELGIDYHAGDIAKVTINAGCVKVQTETSTTPGVITRETRRYHYLAQTLDNHLTYAIQGNTARLTEAITTSLRKNQANGMA